MTTQTKATRSTMPEAEALALLDAAEQADNEDAEFEILRQIPLAPELAMCLATQVGIGAGALKKSGLNLKDAEAEYGTDWLECI